MNEHTFLYLGMNGLSVNLGYVYISRPIIRLVLRLGEHFLYFSQQFKRGLWVCFLHHLIFACPWTVAVIIVVVLHASYGHDGLYVWPLHSLACHVLLSVVLLNFCMLNSKSILNMSAVLEM